MHRYVRLLALPLAVALVAALAIGGALARPDRDGAQQAGGQLLDETDDVDPASLARIVERLADATGIETDAETLDALAERLGVGGAVRAVVWADAAGLTPEEIAALRDGDADTPPMGWGKIRRELDPDGELGLHPGIGWVMRNPDAGAQAEPQGGTGSEDPGAHGRARAAEAQENASGD